MSLPPDHPAITHFQQLEADMLASLAKLRSLLGLAERYAPTAAHFAEAIAVATGNGELVPIISAAESVVEAADKTVNATSLADAVAGAKETAAAVEGVKSAITPEAQAEAKAENAPSIPSMMNP